MSDNEEVSSINTTEATQEQNKDQNEEQNVAAQQVQPEEPTREVPEGCVLSKNGKRIYTREGYERLCARMSALGKASSGRPRKKRSEPAPESEVVAVEQPRSESEVVATESEVVAKQLEQPQPEKTKVKTRKVAPKIPPKLRAKSKSKSAADFESEDIPPTPRFATKYHAIFNVVI